MGSSLKSLSDAKGNPLPQHFQPCPSAAGDSYDGPASSGSNLGPENPDLVEAVTERKQQIATFNRVRPSQGATGRGGCLRFRTQLST